VVTTIDPEVQTTAADKIQTEVGAVVALDAGPGPCLAHNSVALYSGQWQPSSASAQPYPTSR
jgi:hypothetical protein